MHFIRMWKSRVKSTLFQAIKKIINRIVLIKKKFLVKFQIGKKANVSVCDLILNNSNYNELLRWDIIVRYLAIEEYYHKNDFGFKLYRKMQAARIEEKYSWVAVTKFKNLIRSYDNKGYDEKSRIVLDKKLRLVDGSHRIALALYYNIKNINALIIGIEEDNSYSIDWFLANGFSSDEINIINKKYEEIYSRINHSFSCVIWSPAVPYKDEILHDLGLFGRVISVNKRQYRKMWSELYMLLMTSQNGK